MGLTLAKLMPHPSPKNTQIWRVAKQNSTRHKEGLERTIGKSKSAI